MSSVVGKKREAPGSSNGGTVWESKKVKKTRRLILSDSGSDDDKFVVSPRKTAVEADSVDEVKVEALVGSEVHWNGAESPKEEVKSIDGSTSNGDVKVEEKRVASSEVDEEREKGSAHESACGEEVRIDLGKGSGLEIMEKGAEDDSVKIESGLHVEEVNGIGQLASNGTRVETELADNDSHINEKLTADQLAGKEELKEESLTVSRLEVVMKCEEGENIEKARDVSVTSRNGRGCMSRNMNSLDALNIEEEVKIDAKKVLKPKVSKESEDAYSGKKPYGFSQVYQNGVSSMIEKKPSVDQIANKEETEVEAKKDLNKNVAKEREEADATKKSSCFPLADQNEIVSMTKKKIIVDHRSSKAEMNETKKVLESKIVKERAVNSKKRSSVFSGAGPKGGDFFSRKKKNSYVLTTEEEKRLEAERFLKLKVVQEEEADIVKKKGAESGSERKRNRETLDDEIVLKKFRSEHVKHRKEQGMETGEKNTKKKILKTVDEGCDSKASLYSKPVVSGNIEMDEVNEKRIQEDLKKKHKPKSENCRWIQRSTARTLRKLKDNSSSLCGTESDDVHISQYRGLSVHGKGSVLRVLPSNKKVDGIDGGHIQTEEKDNRKSMANLLLTGERKPGKTNSTIKSVKNQLNAGKVSSVKGTGPGKEKTSGGTSSWKVKSKNEDTSKGTSGPIDKGETRSKSEASVMTELNINDETSERRSTLKQRVRDLIKGILLDAGWRIDLRPRRGRCYEDAVWIPPTGGSGFWSITKAYTVYLNSNTFCGNSSEKSTTFTTVPDDLLQMLTRNVVNKRRSSKEIEKAKKKLGVRKKRKVSLKIKGLRDNDRRILRKDDNDGGKVRKKRINDVDAIGSTAHKLHLRVRNKKKRACTLLVRGANQDTDTDDDDDYVPYVWKRTILSWMIDLGIVRADGKVKYMNKKQTRALLEGSITRDGIRCGCCSKIISISKFEIHAGSKLREPHQNILVEEIGTSLLECQLNAWAKQQESERQDFYKVDIEGDDPNDDTCGLCGDGGDLICCDGCPSTFHLNCLGIQMLPPGDWHCTNCSCRYCGLVSDAVPEGSSSASSMLLTCSQCEEKYHFGCIPEADAISTCSKDSDTPFCGKSCRKVFKQLQKLLGTKNDLEAGLSWCLIRRFGEDSSGFPCSLSKKAECNSKIAVAFAVMDECFRPIIDHRSGINLIHNVVYNCGSNINRLCYTGFYTFILERGDEIIAVASVRIHGTRLAEMPFIGTRNMYRRQGMCRQLLNGIESALYSLNVEKLIIPAISELTETWTGVFGFKPLDLSHKQEVSSINMLVFPGTGLLHKPILKKGAVKGHAILEGDEFGESVTAHEHMHKAVREYSVCSPSQPQVSASAADVVHPKIETEGAELSLLPTEKSASPTMLEFQTPHCKLSESVIDVQSEPYQNELTGEDTYNGKYSRDPIIKKPCEGTVRDNQEADDATSLVASGKYTVADTSVGHCSVIEDQNLVGAANESYLLSVRPGLHSVYEVVVPSINEPRDGDITVISSLYAVSASERHVAEDGGYKCEDTATDVLYVKAPVDGVDSEESVEDTEPCMLKENKKPFNIPRTLENEAVGSTVTCTIIKPNSGFQISCRSSIQENSALLQKPLGSTVVAHSSTDKLNHCDNASPTTLHLCPVPELSISSKSEGLLEISPDTNANACCTEGKIHSLDDNSMQCHISKLVDESLGFNSESNTSSSCGIESYEMQPDNHNHRHIMAMDFGSVVHGDSPSAFADVPSLDTFDVKSESGRVPHGHGSVVKSAKVYSGAPLDKVVVQHELHEVNEIAADVSIKPGHCHAEGVLDAATSVCPSSA